VRLDRFLEVRIEIEIGGIFGSIPSAATNSSISLRTFGPAPWRLSCESR
jgi:hypothetical protein